MLTLGHRKSVSRAILGHSLYWDRLNGLSHSHHQYKVFLFPSDFNKVFMGGRQHQAYGAGCSDNQGKELGPHKGPVIKAVKTVGTEEPFTPRHPMQGHPSPALLTTARQAHPWGTLHLYGGGASPPDTSSQEGHHPPQHQLLLSCLLFEARSSRAAQTGLELPGGSRPRPPPKLLGLCMGLRSPPIPAKS